MTTESAPVLVAGAGLAGLSTAMFLGLHEVPALVVERHAGLSTQPKARGQMPPTMEALATAGVAGRFLEAAPPGGTESIIVIAESVTGRVLHDFVQTAPDLSGLSAAPMAATSQERAERILADRAVQLGAEIRFSTILETFRQEDDRVVATLLDTATGRRRTVTSRYLVGADGHKGTIRDAAGIAAHGRTSARPARTMFLQFEADLDVTLRGAAFGLFYLRNPALPGGSVTVVTTDHPGRYVVSCGFGPDEEPDRDALTEMIRTACGVPDLDVTIVNAAWSSSGEHVTRVADTFHSGRVLLAGDAAHLMPPTGGQGGNTAVMDGYHLAWRLAYALAGVAGPGLIASYDAERRPYADALAEQQYANMVQRRAPHLRDDTVAEIMDPAVVLFGYVSPSGAFVREPGEERPLFEDPAAPSGRPGTRAPHVRLSREGVPMSARDLFGTGFTVLAGAEGGIWEKAAAEAARSLRVPIETYVVGGAPELGDPDGRFPAAYGITSTGAVLVRPDGVIAWRSLGEAGLAELEGALRTVLA
ncbi:FAD-dependent monooxygenase [Microbispora sp. H10830]|uniref:FAD-dependent monooxygenase n=1 Tax=Microbispora sp. H10830 TaxID=2729109 RepID=UPI002175F6B4|nr:FAD-dependent monooxygenase [Microbispora sp. H10830]